VTNRFRLFYCDEYVYDVVEAGWRHAFDIRRPRKIYDGLIACGAAEPGSFLAPHAITDEELLLVHTPAYLEQIRDPATLARLLLLDATHPWDARLLVPFRLAAGGTMEAVNAAVFERVVGLNLGGGFHHAQADRAEGFCAIADVAVAVRAVRRRGYDGRVLIVDLDYHHGNGNCLIFAADESVFTFSMHNIPWCFIEKRNNLDIELPAHVDDATYLRMLRESLPAVLERFEPELAIYVAGSDPHIDDLFGDGDLSFRGLLDRDRFVTRALMERDIPFAVVTAGGYGPESWRVHFNYYRWLLTSAEALR
jgi:acetoin utilization deacetylase AcuC-like enzyme